MASFNCVAFWKIEAEDDTSFAFLKGGPRGGKSGCWKVGVTAFEAGLGVTVCERLPDEVLDPEPWEDLFKY
jgi:hypothetical protein